MEPVVLTPAYGASYKTREDMALAWRAGKDFRVGITGPYCSIRDMDELMDQFDDVLLHDYRTGVSFVVY